MQRSARIGVRGKREDTDRGIKGKGWGRGAGTTPLQSDLTLPVFSELVYVSHHGSREDHVPISINVPISISSRYQFELLHC